MINQRTERHIMQRENRAGGLSEEKSGTDETKKLVDSVKPQIERELDIKLGAYDVIGYKTQVVAGLNSYVKIRSGGAYYVLRIFQPLGGQGPNSLSAAKSVSADDEIQGFQ
jgi:cystatin-A/B